MIFLHFLPKIYKKASSGNHNGGQIPCPSSISPSTQLDSEKYFGKNSVFIQKIML